jgi:hypothetical protein
MLAVQLGSRTEKIYGDDRRHGRFTCRYAVRSHRPTAPILLTRDILGSEGNPAGFHVSSSERIVDALVFRAAGGATWIFVVFVIPSFGHV